MKKRGRSNPCRTAAFFVGAAAALVLHVDSTGHCADRATPPANAGYVGSASCRPCHEAEFAAWKGSDHDLAMQEASASTVLGDFHDRTLESHGVVSTFHQKDGKFFVRTDGPDGALADYHVKFTFGVRPLQQYLVEFPGGRLQALPLAWDSRAKEEGGQRWFHLYPGEKLDHDDPLHWTGLYQNWNLQCAACHSTNLRKNYNSETNSYATTYAGINVACETCHGPGAAHAGWAANAHAPYSATDDKGLGVPMQSRPEDAWRFATPDAPFAGRDPAADGEARRRATARLNTCAPCHARRSTLTETIVPGAPLEDSSRPALLTRPLYFADGQQHDEVYTWGSFVQSKMFQRGVTCTDCHDPHTVKRQNSGNAMCAKCHNPSVFDTKSHHFHDAGSKGAQCVECHMPARDYMVIDARRDHSLRVPRPDLTDANGSPDACSSCHAGRTPKWAADAMDGWYGPRWRTRSEYGSTLRKATTEGAKALPSLFDLASGKTEPAIVRATAATLAEPGMRPGLLPRASALLADTDPSVRAAAIGLLEPFPPETRVPAVAPLLSDPVRGVRIEAARVLADVPDEQLSPDARPARAKARTEYLDSLRIDADWPSSLANLGNFHLREGRVDEAVADYQRALKLDPHFAGAYVNLADAWRAQGKDSEGEALLRRGLVLLPDAAGLHHALGLLLVRKGDKATGVDELARAAGLDADNARYAYVWAIGLQSVGKNGEALAALADADRRHPYDIDILQALVSINLQAGRTDAALPYARQLAEALPGDAGIRSLVQKLDSSN